MDEPVPKATLPQIRRYLKLLHRSMNFAEHVVCRAANKTMALERMIKGLGDNDATDEVRAVLQAEAAKIKSSAWDAYGKTPGGRVRMLKHLLGENLPDPRRRRSR
jgi:hypothetical protein